MSVEVTERSIKLKQRDAGEFAKGAMTSGQDFGTVTLRNGIQAVVGKLPGKTGTAVQTLIFDKKLFTEEAATKWASRHGYGAPGQVIAASEGDGRQFMFVDLIQPYSHGKRARSEIAWSGRFKTRKYGWIEFTPGMLENAARVFEETKIHVPLDYAHGSVRAELGPDISRSAGRLEGVEVVRYSDEYVELWGDFSLTPKGAEYVGNGELTFTSAELHDNSEDQDTGKLTGPVLKAVALTNRPVIQGQTPMTMLLSEDAESMIESEPGIEPAEVAMVFNLSEYGGPKEATAEQVLEWGKKLFSDSAAKDKQIADSAEKLRAAEAGASKAAGEASKVLKLAEQVDGLEKKLADAEEKQKTERVERFLSDNGNKIADAKKEEFKQFFLSNEELCRSVVKSMPELYPTQRRSSGGEGKTSTEANAETLYLAEIADVQEKDKLNFTDAAALVNKRKPELYKAYSAQREATKPAVGGSSLEGEVV